VRNLNPLPVRKNGVQSKTIDFDPPKAAIVTRPADFD